MRITALLLGTLMSTCLFSSALVAQAGLREGSRIRITSTSGPDMTGVVQSFSSDSIFIFAEPNGNRLGVARSSISEVRVSKGKSVAQGVKKGALWGGLIGVGAGAIVIAGGGDDAQLKRDTGFSKSDLAATAVLEGLGIGMLIGALVKAEKWETTVVHPTVSAGQIGLRVSLRFR